MTTIRPIKIKPAHNGYIVKVGCKTLVFTSRKKLVKKLARYLADPDKVEREYAHVDTIEAPWGGGQTGTASIGYSDGSHRVIRLTPQRDSESQFDFGVTDVDGDE